MGGIHTYDATPTQKEEPMDRKRRVPPANLPEHLKREFEERTVTQVAEDDEMGVEQSLAKLGDLFPKSGVSSSEAQRLNAKRRAKLEKNRPRRPEELARLHTPKWRQHLSAITSTLMMVAGISLLFVMIITKRPKDRDPAENKAPAARLVQPSK